jgi:phosphatidylinositol alpha-1,6-mannosyltransferase
VLALSLMCKRRGLIYVDRMDGLDRSGSQRPRLLILTPDFPPAPGGVQVLAHQLAVGLSGFHTRVVALDCPGAGAFDREGALAVRRVRGGVSRRAGNVALNAAALLAAARFRPQATLSVHVVVSPAAAVIRRALRARTVQYFHAKEIADKPRLSAFAAARADAVIAVSSYTADLIARTGVSPACLRLIPPGVELPPARSAANGTRPTVLTIARLEDRYKGHDVLIGALARVRVQVPDVEWIVIGEGPLRGELEALAISSGLADTARFLGPVSDEQRDRWLACCDLLAMPSRLPGGGRAGEGFGMVYLEAGAHGKPVIAGNVAGAVDAVADGESGLLVDPTDVVAVADAVTMLLRDSGLAQRMGAAGAARAQSFAWPLIAARVEALLLEQLARASGTAGRGRRAHRSSARTAA